VPGASHIQVNRSLRHEFTTVLARDPWVVLLLQELPPRWIRPLAKRTGARAGASVLTSRNFGALLRGLIADIDPDLIRSGEGGSNGVLVRHPWRIAEVRRLTLTRVPERRRMIWARLQSPDAKLCVANLHATAGDDQRAAHDVALAAQRAVEWSGDLPLVFGGDLNLRPARTPAAFVALHGLTGVTGPKRIDHLLARGLERRGPTEAMPAGWREVHDSRSGKLLRLSDHDAIAAEFEVPSG
jgi:endonuclease/exonuclease/phosphatase family metal-dependent hydrolase